MCVTEAPACFSAPARAILPNALLDGVKEEGKQNALIALVNSVIKNTANALEQRHPLEFDCTPGDFACEVLALYILRYFDDQDLVEEAKRAALSGHLFNLPISGQLSYLYNCHLLKTLRKEKERLPNGVVHTRTDLAALKELSPDIISLSYKERRKIVETSQRRVSETTMEFIRAEALRVKDTLLIEMVSERHTHRFSISRKIEPKSIGCLFYKTRVVLESLKSRKELFAVRNIAPEAQNRFSLFFQADKNGKFRSVNLEVKESERKRLLIVFEAVLKVGMPQEELRKLFDGKIDDYILGGAAMIEQYEKGFPTDKIPCQQAKKEILAYKAMGKNLGCGLFDSEDNKSVITMDHVYCSTLEEASPFLFRRTT